MIPQKFLSVTISLISGKETKHFEDLAAKILINFESFWEFFQPTTVPKPLTSSWLAGGRQIGWMSLSPNRLVNTTTAMSALDFNSNVFHSGWRIIFEIDRSLDSRSFKLFLFRKARTCWGNFATDSNLFLKQFAAEKVTTCKTPT